ncbi:hypothetical protein QBC40DRAFT_292264 [Triangularia verruculosa]|uniref:Uncharacterized protein n=1 Tax=Triangularia verruculosa TaxID=2587418 RepID=A0AAN6XQH6_9PEZI|nr:hypothetical protein QBC40DRAFT_292264 [Triangularia verruculosa]
MSSKPGSELPDQDPEAGLGFSSPIGPHLPQYQTLQPLRYTAAANAAHSSATAHTSPPPRVPETLAGDNTTQSRTPAKATAIPNVSDSGLTGGTLGCPLWHRGPIPLFDSVIRVMARGCRGFVDLVRRATYLLFPPGRQPQLDHCGALSTELELWVDGMLYLLTGYGNCSAGLGGRSEDSSPPCNGARRRGRGMAKILIIECGLPASSLLTGF